MIIPIDYPLMHDKRTDFKKGSINLLQPNRLYVNMKKKQVKFANFMRQQSAGRSLLVRLY